MTCESSAKFRALYELWKSKLDGRPAPRRSDLPAEELGPWMGHIVLVRAVGSPRRFLLRLIGMAVNDYDGADYTGRYLDEVLTPPVKDVVLGQYERCASSLEPRVYGYASTRYRDRMAVIEKLFLPFSEDGRAASHVLVCIYARFHRSTDSLVQTIQDLEGEGGTIGFHPEDLATKVA